MLVLFNRVSGVPCLSLSLSRNPRGRTGLMGRGSLPRWGPNHVFEFIITRYTYFLSRVYLYLYLCVYLCVCVFECTHSLFLCRWAFTQQGDPVYRDGRRVLEVMLTKSKLGTRQFVVVRVYLNIQNIQAIT